MTTALWNRWTNRQPNRRVKARRPAPRLRGYAELLERRDTPAPFTAGNLVIYRVGDGVAPLVNTGSAVFLDEYTPAGSLVQSVAMPGTTVGGPNLIASGTATSEGLLSLSPDGKNLALTGYNRELGGVGSLAGTNSATVNRTVAVVDSNANASFTLLSDFADGNNPRSAVTPDGKTLYVAGGAGGARYVANLADTTSTQLSTTVTNLRQLNIFGGQLYTSTASGSAVRLGTVGTGLPTTSGQTISTLAGLPTSTGSPYGYFFADLSVAEPGLDTVYIADDGTATGFQKFSLVLGTWTANGNVAVTGNGLRGLTGSVSGSTVTLYGTNGATLVSLVDSSGYNATITGTVSSLATAGANTAFRGVAFTPQGSATTASVVSVTTSPTSVVTGTPVTYTATFSAAVAGLTAGNFTLTTTGSVAGTIGTPTTSDNITFTVPVTGVTGTGTLRLDVTNSTGVTPPLNNLPFTKGTVVTVTPPGATLDVVAGKAIYTASAGKSNNVSLGLSSGNYSVNDIAELINLTAAALAAGWTGGGSNTVTGPDTKTDAVEIVLGDGADSFTLNGLADPLTVTGGGNVGDTASFPASITLAGAASVTGFDTISQNLGVVLAIDDLTLGGGTIGSFGTPIRTTSTKVAALAGDGGLFVTETNGAGFTVQATGPGTINVNNLAGTLAIDGASKSAAGAISLSSADGVAVNAALGDLNTAGDINIAANTNGAGAEGYTTAATGSVATKSTSATAVTVTVNTLGGGTGGAEVGGITAGATGIVTIDANGGSITFYTGKSAVRAGGFVEPPIGEVILKTSGAASAIGTLANPVQTATGFITVTAGSGGLFVLETAEQPTVVRSATATGAGDVRVDTASVSDNGLWVQGPVTTGSGNITLRADDDFKLQAGGSVGGSTFSGKILIEASLDGINQQAYLQSPGTSVETTNTAADAVVITNSGSTNNGGIPGAVLGNIKVGVGGGITVDAGRLLGNATDTDRAGLIVMVDAGSILDAGATGTVTLKARDNGIGDAFTPIRVNAGVVSAVTNSTDKTVNPLQGDGDVFVTAAGPASFSGATTTKSPRVGDIAFATLSGDLGLNGDVTVDDGVITLNSAGNLNQTAGKIVTTGPFNYVVSSQAVFGGTGNSVPAVNVANGITALVNGSFVAGNFTVDGTLGGNGSVAGDVAVNATGTVAPGVSPGKLSTGNHSFVAGSTFAVELNGTTPGTGYDQLAVTGTVNLGGAKLSATLGFTPPSGAVFRIIDNDGGDAVTGNFVGLPEGAIVTVGATNFTLSYKGGDGNDVTLKAPGVGAPPPTVSTVAVNGGGAQRSMVTSIVVTFSEAVSFPSGINAAFQLARIGQPSGGPSVAAPLGLVNTSAVQAGAQVTITFANGGAVPIDQGKSLLDGLYQLTIVASNVTGTGGDLDGDGNGTGGDNFQTPAAGSGRITRLFGDSDGDGDTDAVDYGQFRGAFGGANPTFDFDGDGDVDAVDFGQFRQRFGVSV